MATIKKNSSEMSVEEKLKTLFQLQVTLSAIDEKRALRGELPLEVGDLEDEIAGLNTRLQKIQDEVADYQSAVSQKRNEIEQYQHSVDHYKEQRRSPSGRVTSPRYRKRLLTARPTWSQSVQNLTILCRRPVRPRLT